LSDRSERLQIQPTATRLCIFAAGQHADLFRDPITTGAPPGRDRQRTVVGQNRPIASAHHDFVTTRTSHDSLHGLGRSTRYRLRRATFVLSDAHRILSVATRAARNTIGNAVDMKTTSQDMCGSSLFSTQTLLA
jgi:hypothetical protein